MRIRERSGISEHSPAFPVRVDLRGEHRLNRHGAGELPAVEAVFLGELGAAGVRSDAGLAAVEDHRGLGLPLQLVVVPLRGELFGGVVGGVEGEGLAGGEEESVSRDGVDVGPAASPVGGILLREDVGLVVLRDGGAELSGFRPRRYSRSGRR